MKHHTNTEPLTDNMIIALRVEAAKYAPDMEAACELALEGNRKARRTCVNIINGARIGAFGDRAILVVDDQLRDELDAVRQVTLWPFLHAFWWHCGRVGVDPVGPDAPGLLVEMKDALDPFFAHDVARGCDVVCVHPHRAREWSDADVGRRAC